MDAEIKLSTELDEDIQNIRSKICDAMLIAFGFFAIPATLSSLNRISEIGWLNVMAGHIFLTVMLCFIIFIRKKLTYKIKASFIIITCLVVGISGIYNFGLMAGGIPFLVIVGPIVALLFSGRAGLSVLALVVFSEIIIGILIVSKKIDIPVDTSAYIFSSSAWIVAILAIILASGMLTVSIHTFNSNMNNVVRKSRRHEKDLLIHQMSLEKTIDERTNELNRSNEDLKQFARVAAHDMQSPLNAISGHVQLLELEFEGIVNEEAKEHFKDVIDGVRYMSKMINDLLGYSDINKDFGDQYPVDMNAVVDKSKKQLLTEIDKSSAEINCDDLPQVYAVESQVVRVIQNILSNAIKYKKSEQDLIIKISAIEKNDDWEFSVSDNGIGIDQQHAKKIFEMFHQIDANNNSESSGIGLDSCKKIIERHGGHIWVESKLGEGCDFKFTLKKS